MEIDQQPLVSIITPMYNSAPYVTETIESVLKQTYPNWQLILIDDGSSDSSLQISQDYARKYPSKILCFYHDGNVNKGVTATRNLGIAQAKGSLVALLDSDDLWMPEYLEEQVKFMVEHQDVDMLCQASIYWRSWMNPKDKDEVILVGAEPEKKYLPPQLAIELYPLGKGAAPCMDGIVIRTAALKKIGGFEESFKGKEQLYEDQAFAIKNYLHNVIYISSSAKNIYRQRPQSLMHGIIDEGLYNNGRYFFLRWLKDYLRQQQINDRAVNRLLIKSLLPFKFPYLYKMSAGLRWRYQRLLKRDVQG